jgi:hypothetical protein
VAAGQAAASGRAHLQARPARSPQVGQGEGKVWPAVNVRGHASRVVARSASGCKTLPPAPMQGAVHQQSDHDIEHTTSGISRGEGPRRPIALGTPSLEGEGDER